MRFHRSIKIRISYTERIPVKRKNFSCIYKFYQVHTRIKLYISRSRKKTGIQIVKCTNVEQNLKTCDGLWQKMFTLEQQFLNKEMIDSTCNFVDTRVINTLMDFEDSLFKWMLKKMLCKAA